MKVNAVISFVTSLTDEEWEELRRKNAEQNRRSENNRH